MSGNLGANLINQLQNTPMASPDYWTHQMANMNALQDYNAKQAWGQALQQATDQTTGTVDYGKAQALAAGNPMARAGMAANLANTSNIRSQQIDQVSATYDLAGRASASALNDPSDANMANIRASLVTAGAPASMVSEVDRIAALPVAQRGAEAYKHLNAVLDGQGMLARGNLPAPVNQQVGTAIVPTQTPAPTPWSPTATTTVGGGGVTVGPPPGTRTPGVVPTDEQGVIPQDANGVPVRPPKSWQPISVPGSPGVPGGGQQITTPPASGSGPAAPSASGGGPPAPPANPAGTVIRSPGAYAPPGSLGAPTTGNRGTPPPAPVSSTPLPAPTATPAPAQPPAVTPASPAPVASATPPVFTSAPQGQPEKLAADVGAYTQDQAAYPGVQTRAQNMAHAYDALQQMQSATGKGAAGIQNLRSWAQTLGVAPQGAVDEATLMDLVNKYATRSMLDAAGGTSTDMGKTLQQEANAGTLLTKPANLQVLRNDMGKSLQTMAAYQDQKDKTGNGYLSNRAGVAEATDPRGFAWNLYSPTEQAQINAEVAKDPVAAAKLHKAIGMATRLNLQIPGPTLTPPAQKQSFLTPPPASQQNALQMTG